MKIAFMDVFEAGNNAEAETTQRLKYCIEKQGHSFYTINSEGFFIDRSEYQDTHIDNTDIDFFYTFNHFERMPVLPNKVGIFFHWAPSGHFPAHLLSLYISNMNCFDDVFGGYESLDAFLDTVSSGMENASLIHIGSSVPLDYVIAPQANKRKLFYVGINVEKKTGTQRFGNLFRLLDQKNKIAFFGPNDVFGIKGCWDGYKNYKGAIPFDGKTIIKKINECGVCLALNSPAHNNAGTVSNRIYEAAAAGAIIISDDNVYVRKYFGDSVFYIDINKKEDELCRDILNILSWIDEHPLESFKKANDAQTIFKKKLSLDLMLKQAINKISASQYAENLSELIDVICFIKTQEEYLKIMTLLSSQYYKTINTIIISDDCINDRVKADFDIIYIVSNLKKKGEAFAGALEHIKGNYFIILDGASDMQNRHIKKIYSALSRNKSAYFAYTGCYEKNISNSDGKTLGYYLINDIEISTSEFLSFKGFHGTDMEYVLHIDNIFATSCVLFKRSILDFVDKNELSLLSDSVHFYLALCSIFKINNSGLFVKLITAGYQCYSSEGLNNYLNNRRRSYYLNAQSYNLLFKDLNRIFLNYSYPMLSDVVMQKNLYKRQQKAIVFECDKFYFKLKKRIVLYVALKILSYRARKKYQHKRLRMYKYYQEHKIIQLIFKKLKFN